MSSAAQVTVLGNGLRVVTEEVASVRSVALGLWVRTGSRDESAAEAGLSHLLEHLLFKGTARHSAIEISEILDGIGAAVNAGTSKESTNLHARFLDRHLGQAFDLLSEMFLAPTFPEVDSERQVIAEEIAMYEDEPADRVHDHLAEALFGDSPLGRRILGSSEVVTKVPVAEIDGYHRRHYRPERSVVSAAGNLSHEQLVGLAEQTVSFPESGPEAEGPAANGEAAPYPAARSLRFQAKETEQYHICIGSPGLPRSDERRYVMAVLDSILGGSTSSRLFREVREKRGLAYAIGSFQESYVDTGMSGIYVGTREDNVPEACRVIGAELARIAGEEVTGEELQRGRESVKGRLVLAFESTAPRMSRNARAILFDLPLESLDQMIAAVDAVSAEDVASLAAELYGGAGLSAAAIGRDEDVFRRAVASIDHDLAAV